MRHARREVLLRMVRSCNSDIVLWGSKLTSKAKPYQETVDVSSKFVLSALDPTFGLFNLWTSCGLWWHHLLGWIAFLQEHPPTWVSQVTSVQIILWWLYTRKPRCDEERKRIKRAEDTYSGAVFAVLTFSFFNPSILMIILLRQSYINFSFDDALKYWKMFAGIRKKTQNKCME